jgi:hypothetical protein
VEPTQASLARLLNVCVIEEMSSEQAKAVGVLLGRSSGDDVIDATVVEGALRRRDSVISSDPTDLRTIADCANAPLNIEPI